MDITIQEGTDLIISFMGYERKQGKQLANYISGGGSWYIVGENFTELESYYCPDSNWNHLMPVVQRIQDIDITPPPNYSGYRIEIVVKGYVQIKGSGMPTILTNVSKEGSLINAIWKAVVQFIQWYNTLTPSSKSLTNQ